MRSTRSRIALVGVAWLASLAVGGASAREGAGTALDCGRMGWSSLTMGASKFGFTLESTISSRFVSKAEAERSFVAVPEGVDPVESRGQVVEMRVRTEFLGRSSRTDFWLDAANGRALQWTVVESGRKERYKASRALADGVWVLRKDPADGSERNLPREQWTRVRDGVEPFSGLPPGEPLSVSAGILYVLATAPLQQVGDRLEVYLESDGRVFPVSIRVAEMDHVSVEYSRSGPGGSARVDARVPALRVTLRPRTPPGMDPREFEFMGLEGDVDVWLDAGGRYPLQISGKVKYAGSVKIRLKSVLLSGG